MKAVPESLAGILSRLPACSLAFSGGADSSYLLYALKESGADARPVFVRTEFQTEREESRAKGFCERLGIEMEIVRIGILSDPSVAANGPDRCYLCKRRIMGAVASFGRAVADGTNASDDPAARPGMRALAELGVMSPLREAGLTKADVSALSREAGLPTWDLPSDSCLATRVPCGTPIEAWMLERTERAEDDVRSLGLDRFRVRSAGSAARLEVPSDLMGKARAMMPELERALLKYYGSVELAERRA